MKKNSDSNKFLLPIVFIVAVVFIWKRDFFSTEKPKKSNEINIIADEPEPTPWETDKVPTTVSPSPDKEVTNEELTKTEVKEVEEPIDNFKELVKRQNLLKREFLSSVKANIELPDDMNYTNIDADEGIGIIYGRSKVGDREFAMLATTKKVNMKLATQYLNENPEMLPLLKDLKITKNLKTKSIKAPRGSGLKSVSYTKLGQKDGKTVYGVLTTRSDNRGSYMFLMKADKNFYENNEGYLDKMLSSLKAKK